MRAIEYLAALMLLPLSSHGQSSVATEQDTRHVVVVRMGNPSAPATLAGAKAFRDSLVTRVPFPVVISDESLDAAETMGLDRRQENRHAERLREKYANTRIDLIVAVASVSLDFVLRHRATFAPGVPVAYYDVSDRRLTKESLPEDVGGLTLRWDIAGTLALATRLQPDARNVVYVAGTARYDQVFEAIFDEAMQANASRLRVSKLIGLSLAELQRQLAELPPDSIVLYASMMRDSHGAQYQPRDLVSWLSASSNAPLYTFAGTYVGAGAIGGSVVDFEENGRRAGAYGADRLQNQIRTAVPTQSLALPSICQIDDRQRKRWKIARSRVPKNCRILYATTAVWASSTGALVIAGCLALLTGAMTIALRMQRRKRLTAEREAQLRRGEAVHAARLAVVGKISASIMHEVNQPLSAILSNADAAEMLLERKDPSLDQVREILADIRRDNARAHRIVSQLRLLLRKGQLQLQPLDLNEVVAAVLGLIKSEASRLRVQVVFRAVPLLPRIAGDPVHLQQVLMNLLVNALDALESTGAADRSIEIEILPATQDALCVRVRDSGNGIAPDDLPRLFDSFFTTKHDGMGLGLSIAKTIVEAHHGTLTAENWDGGAEFSMTMPILTAGATAKEASETAQTSAA